MVAAVGCGHVMQVGGKRGMMTPGEGRLHGA